MAKRESTLVNMVLALFVITLVSAASLGGVFELTKGPIAKSKEKKLNDAIIKVVPEYDNSPGEEMYEIKPEDGAEMLQCFPAKKDGKLVGTAIKTYTNSGFSGLIRVMVGLKPDGTINQVSVLEHKETPGLGTKMSDASFKNQFVNKNPESFKVSVTKDGGEIDAITAATISSRAFCDAVVRAHKAYMKGGKK